MKKESKLRNWAYVFPEKGYEAYFKIENNIIFAKNGKYGIMDKNENIIIEPYYDKIHCHLYRYRKVLTCIKDGYYGAIKPDGTILLDCVFEKLSGFSKSGNYLVAKIHKNPKKAVISVDKKLILPFKFDKIDICYNYEKDLEYFIAIKDKKEIYFNTNGEEIEPMKGKTK